jgi:amidase
MSQIQSNRRTLLKGAALLAGAKFLGRALPAAGAARKFDPSFGTATDALAALGSGEISSRELTEHVFARIRRHNTHINAFITLLEEQALAQARQADEQRARKRVTGALHGLPVLVKDVFATAGIRTTSGSRTLADYVPNEDAVVVSRLKQAGAIVVGKTNTPEFAGDVQTYNDIAGTTNNPWDLTRTPGGSTGGGAAALAAGFGFLEVGSDIGGSIRIPAGFCGVYGHKPTQDIVPLDGHIPPPPNFLPSPEVLPVLGPLARSADDLILDLGVLAGPAGDSAKALRWSLPPPRKGNLRDYKVGVVLDDPFCPVDGAVLTVLSEAVASLQKAGVQIEEGWPAGFDPKVSYENYLFLLGATLEQSSPDAAIEAMREAIESGVVHSYLHGATSTYRAWAAQNQLRLRARAAWREYFKTYDAFLSPVSFVAAIPHNHQQPRRERRIDTSGGAREYDDMSKWISHATLSGCPATAVPVGKTASGLPVSLQIMGPFMEDATPIDLAMKMAPITGGFVPPPGYDYV